MIDLSKDLPDAVEVDGKSYLIKTDFREWLKFAEIIESGNATLLDITYLFVDEIPPADFSNALVEFCTNPNLIPNYNGVSNERLLDYLIDSEYIYASFMAEYGIDLCDPNLKMHWHKFKALLIGMKDDSKIKEIMATRSYTPSKKDPEKIALENKRAWALPSKDSQIEDEELEKLLDELFYNC